MAQGWRIVVQDSSKTAPGVDTDILAAADGAAVFEVAEQFRATADIQFAKPHAGWTMRINIVCAGLSKVYLHSDEGKKIYLNGGVAMVANQNHVEDFFPDPARTYNLRIDTADGAIDHLSILAVEGPNV
jgi:hypothetical protein